MNKKLIQQDGMWLLSLGIVLILTGVWNLDYNALTLVGAILIARGFIGIIKTFLKGDEQ